MLNENGVENLRVAILKQAINDYIFALREDAQAEIYRLETFFKSDWGELLSNNHSDYIITECKKRAKGGAE
jgi:hypothetical protein